MTKIGFIFLMLILSTSVSSLAEEWKTDIPEAEASVSEMASSTTTATHSATMNRAIQQLEKGQKDSIGTRLDLMTINRTLDDIRNRLSDIERENRMINDRIRRLDRNVTDIKRRNKLS